MKPSERLAREKEQLSKCNQQRGHSHPSAVQSVDPNGQNELNVNGIKVLFPFQPYDCQLSVPLRVAIFHPMSHVSLTASLVSSLLYEIDSCICKRSLPLSGTECHQSVLTLADVGDSNQKGDSNVAGWIIGIAGEPDRNREDSVVVMFGARVEREFEKARQSQGI